MWRGAPLRQCVWHLGLHCYVFLTRYVCIAVSTCIHPFLSFFLSLSLSLSLSLFISLSLCLYLSRSIFPYMSLYQTCRIVTSDKISMKGEYIRCIVLICDWMAKVISKKENSIKMIGWKSKGRSGLLSKMAGSMHENVYAALASMMLIMGVIFLSREMSKVVLPQLLVRLQMPQYVI